MTGGRGEDFDSEGTIVLRSTEQTVDGKWRIDDSARRALDEFEIASSLLTEGDIVITKSSGSAHHIGKASIVTPDIAALDRLTRMDPLELKAGVARVLFPDYVALPRTALNLFRQLSKEVPKFSREV